MVLESFSLEPFASPTFGHRTNVKEMWCSIALDGNSGLKSTAESSDELSDGNRPSFIGTTSLPVYLEERR